MGDCAESEWMGHQGSRCERGSTEGRDSARVNGVLWWVAAFAGRFTTRAAPAAAPLSRGGVSRWRSSKGPPALRAGSRRSSEYCLADGEEGRGVGVEASIGARGNGGGGNMAGAAKGARKGDVVERAELGSASSSCRRMRASPAARAARASAAGVSN